MPLTFILFLIPHSLSAIQEQDSIWILTDSNIQEALQKQNDLLVFFSKPDCPYCSKLLKPYSKAAKRLKALIPPIHIAKVDSSANPELTQKYNPSSFPYFIYIRKDKVEPFPATRSEDSFFSWVSKQNNQPYTLIPDINTLQSRLQKTNLAVVYFGDLDTNEYRVFTVVSKTVDDPSFFICTDPKAASVYSVLSPAVVIFKQFDDKRVDFEGNFLTSELVAFIEKHKNPWIVEFDESVDDLIYMKKKICLLLLRHFSEAKDYDKVLKKISRQLEGKIVVAYLDISTEEHRNLAQTLGVLGKRQPMALILDPANDLRYLFEGKISEDSLKSFLKDWKSAKLTPLVRSKEIPEKEFDKGVRVLVGKTFESVAYNKDLDVLVLFCTESSEECKKFMGKYEKLAEALKDVQGVRVCKIDALGNEVRGIKIEKVPAIWMFPAGNKKSLEFKGALDEAEIMSFLRKHSKGPWRKQDL